MIKTRILVAEETVQYLRAHIFLQRTWVHFLDAIRVYGHLNPIPGNSNPSPDHHRHRLRWQHTIYIGRNNHTQKIGNLKKTVKRGIRYLLANTWLLLEIMKMSPNYITVIVMYDQIMFLKNH